MTMTVVFEDYEDMMKFARRLMGQAPSGGNTSQGATAESTLGVTPETLAPAPVQQTPVTPPVQQPVYTAPVQQAPVTPTAPSYTLDDLTRAAIPLMDSGKQPELLQLIRSFGVEALPSLQPEQYGAFATALRGLGAQI